MRGFVLMHQKRWQDALEATEAALELMTKEFGSDPNHFLIKQTTMRKAFIQNKLNLAAAEAETGGSGGSREAVAAYELVKRIARQHKHRRRRRRQRCRRHWPQHGRPRRLWTLLPWPA